MKGVIFGGRPWNGVIMWMRSLEGVIYSEAVHERGHIQRRSLEEV